MSVGYAGVTKNDVDTTAGNLALAIRDLLVQIETFQSFLAGKTDDQLTALGYSTDDIALLKSAFSQLDALRLVATGQQAQASANNFLFFSNQIVGVR